jgi:hypothetical protein
LYRLLTAVVLAYSVLDDCALADSIPTRSREPLGIHCERLRRFNLPSAAFVTSRARKKRPEEFTKYEASMKQTPEFRFDKSREVAMQRRFENT